MDPTASMLNNVGNPHHYMHVETTLLQKSADWEKRIPPLQRP